MTASSQRYSFLKEDNLQMDKFQDCTYPECKLFLSDDQKRKTLPVSIHKESINTWYHNNCQ